MPRASEDSRIASDATGALASANGYPRIRVYRQKGPGYWACIYFQGGGIEAVQSPQIYGFPTKEEARAEALRRCADNHDYEINLHSRSSRDS